MSELFDTSLYEQKVSSGTHDPAWDKPDFDWERGDIGKILDLDGRVLTVVVIEILGKRCVVSFPDYEKEQITYKKVPLHKLIATKQTHWRRKSWELAPILLEKLGTGCRQWRTHELAQELNLTLGEVSQCLEKLELEGKVCHSANWIYSLVLEPGSCSQDSNSDSGSSPVQMMMNSVQISSRNASPELKTGETLQPLIGNGCPPATSGPHHHHVSPSQSEAREEADWTIETDSPRCSEESNNASPDAYALKMSQDYSTALTFQEKNSSIFPGSSKGYPSSGMMRNGKLSPATTLVPRGKGSASSSLPTPTALSGGSGLMKLENYLREVGAIASSQVVNPILLEIGMGLPSGWTNPRMPNTVLEFLQKTAKSESEGKLLETPSTTESQSQPSQPASDCWNPNHFGEAKFRNEDEQLTIFFDDSEEPPLPEDCKNLEEFEQKWKEWEERFPQLSGKILEESEAPCTTKEPPILLEKESDRSPTTPETFLEELRSSTCNTGTESSSEHHQILLEKIQEEIEDSLDEDELYSHVTAAEILEQEEWEKPYTAVPRSSKGYAKGQTGQLYSYGQRKKSKYGEPDSMYYWGYSYQVWDGFKWRSKSKSVPLTKLSAVREAIASRLGVEAVLAML